MRLAALGKACKAGVAHEEVDALHATTLLGEIRVVVVVLESPVAVLVGLGSEPSVLVGQSLELELCDVASEEFVETLKDVD